MIGFCINSALTVHFRQLPGEHSKSTVMFSLHFAQRLLHHMDTLYLMWCTSFHRSTHKSKLFSSIVRNVLVDPFKHNNREEHLVPFGNSSLFSPYTSLDITHCSAIPQIYCTLKSLAWSIEYIVVVNVLRQPFNHKNRDWNTTRQPNTGTYYQFVAVTGYSAYITTRSQRWFISNLWFTFSP